MISTFWSVISEKGNNKNGYRILIPIIQRDYVQGRADSDAYVEAALDKLLDDMLYAVKDTNPGSPGLNLNFVYGKPYEDIDRQDVFPPIDGQQRLTTLYLLHLYAFWKERHKYSKELKLLSERFKYETRDTTAKFMTELLKKTQVVLHSDEDVQNVNLLDELQEYDNLLDGYIKDQSWFRAEWKKDPSVTSMLYVLQKIHKRFEGVSDLADRLINTNCIGFMILSSNKISIDDDLYIKLNHRGKSLSEFENFKADVIKYLEDKKEFGLSKDFAEAVNYKYVDLFWDENDTEKFDERVMAFFHWTFYCELLVNSDLKAVAVRNKSNMSEEGEKSEKINRLLDARRLKKNFFRLKDYEDPENPESCDHTETVKKIIKVLKLVKSVKDDRNALTNDEDNNLIKNEAKNNAELYKHFYDDAVGRFEGILTYWDESSGSMYQKIVMYNALFLFTSYSEMTEKVVLKYGQINNQIESWHTGWFRITKNLIVNSLINSMPMFQVVMKNMKQVACKCDSFLAHFADDKTPIKETGLGRFGDYRGYILINEEHTKANLIVFDENGTTGYKGWKAAILRAEKELPYFTGQIKVLLDFSENKLAKFEKYLELFKVLFDGGGIKDNFVSPFRSALLAAGDYYMNGCSFVSNGFAPKGTSWRSLLNNDNSCRNVFREFIDSLDINELNSDDSIIKVLKDKTKNWNGDETDWKYHFIKTEEVMDHIKTYARFNNSDLYNEDVNSRVNNRIILLSGQNASSYGWELYTFVLAVKLGVDISKNYKEGVFSSEIGFPVPGKDGHLIRRKLDESGKKSEFELISIPSEDIPALKIILSKKGGVYRIFDLGLVSSKAKTDKLETIGNSGALDIEKALEKINLL